MHKRLCICDVESIYLKRLTAYLNRKPDCIWRIKTYTELELCLQERPELLLVSGSALEQWQKQRKSKDHPEILGCQVIFLEDEKSNPGMWPAVKKYQAAGKLYEDLLEILAEEILSDTEVIGVFGPSNGPEAERYAQEIGKEYLEKGEVLILSLAEFSIFSVDQSDGNGIGEWFYYYSQHTKEKIRLSEWVFTEERLNYLQGFRTIYDQKGVKLDDWQDFFKEGLRKSRYNTVILVFDRMPEYMELFMWCDSIYVQWGQDSHADFRKQKFEKMAAYMGMGGLISKFIEQQ